MLRRFTQNKPQLLFIYLTVFVTLIGFGMVLPLLPFYAKLYNASETTIGLLAASFAIAQFLFSPIWGRASDRYGRKPIISLGLLGLSLAFLVFGIAHNLEWLFVSRFLQGVFSGAALPVAQAYVADVTTKDERIKGMGNLGAALALGFLFGPGLGGVLSGVSVSFPFFVAAGLAAVNFALVQLFLPESLSQRTEKLLIKEGFLNIRHMYQGLKGEMGYLFVMIFLWSYALSNNQVAVPLFGYEYLNLSIITVGLFFSCNGAVSALVQSIFVHKITHRLGEHKTATFGLAIMAVALFLMPFSKIGLMMGVFMMLMAFGSALTRPTLTTLLSKETKEGQGTTMGVATAFDSLGRMLGPLMGGWLFSTFDYHSPFTSTTVLILITLLLVVQIKGFFRN